MSSMLEVEGGVVVVVASDAEGGGGGLSSLSSMLEVEVGVVIVVAGDAEGGGGGLSLSLWTTLELGGHHHRCRGVVVHVVDTAGWWLAM